MFFFILLFILSLTGVAQENTRLSLQQAYDLAQKNYPVIRQKDLVRQTTALTVENLQKNFLPQVTISGQASYQSDVTSVPLTLPGLSIEPPSKDQYKLVADVNQLIYDGGVTREQKKIQLQAGEVEEQKTEVELYKLKERVNQLYLGVLYLDEQLKQAGLIKADISNGIKKVEAQVANGVSFRSSLNMLKAELLKTDQRVTEIQSSRKGFTDALGLLLGQPLNANVVLEKPVAENRATAEISRPEIKLFSAQTSLISAQEQLINAKNQPKASLFLQGGYGRPGLNMLKNEFDLYYITGIRLSWSLGSLYTKKREKEIASVNRKMVAVQQETFLLNTQTQLAQQAAEITKLEKLVATDEEIIGLRVSVKEAAQAQLENGVITANDFLKEVNAEDQARQAKITHQLQLLQARINYNTLAGKQ
ncbi:MAG: TolC family protein [Chitinophagaceae bacterium]|nr:TolC family protein [Chitinophagaceae bacterium]